MTDSMQIAGIDSSAGYSFRGGDSKARQRSLDDEEKESGREEEERSQSNARQVAADSTLGTRIDMEV